VIPLPAHSADFVCSKELPANQLASARARRFLREVLTGRLSSTATPPGQDPIPAPGTVPQGLVDNAVLLVSELVTNAVVYAGTDIDVVCRLERHPDAAVAVVVEVADRHPSRGVRGAAEARHGEPGYGLQLVSALSQAWGVTYRRSEKRVWFRLESSSAEPGFLGADATPARTGETGAPGTAPPGDAGPPEHLAPSHGYAAEWVDRGGPSFLAETSELLAGQLDPGMVAALAAQLLVPRLADWCGIWLRTQGGGLKLSRVWHVDEKRIVALREERRGHALALAGERRV
jgi:hypothetical protein